MIRGQNEEIAMFILDQNSLMITIDILGYGFMCLATLFVAFAFTDGKLQRWICYLFIANGLLVFPILLQVYWPELVYIAGLWTVTFIVPVILLAVLFRKAMQTNS
jgi:hydrogenase-4 membrane subunit HyfE